MRRRPPLLVLAGAFTGLAWLTRIDGILLIPALVVAIGVWWQFGGQPIRWRWVGMMFLAIAVVMAPWLWRNLDLFGQLMLGDSPFF